MPKSTEIKCFAILVFALLASLSNAMAHEEGVVSRRPGDGNQDCTKKWSKESLIETLQKRNSGIPQNYLQSMGMQPKSPNPLQEEPGAKNDPPFDIESLRQLTLNSLACPSASDYNKSLLLLLTLAVTGETSNELDSLRQLYPPIKLMNEQEPNWKKALLLQAKEFSEKGMQANLLDSLKELVDGARKNRLVQEETFNQIYLLFEHPMMNLILGADIRRALVRRLTEIPPEKTEVSNSSENLGNSPPTTTGAVAALKKELAAFQSGDPQQRLKAANDYWEALAKLHELSPAERAPIKAWLRELSTQIQRGQVASKDERERNLLQDRLDDAYRAVDSGGTTLHEEARTWQSLSDNQRHAIETLEKYLHESGNAKNGEFLGVDIQRLAKLTEGELGVLVEYTKKPSAALDQHLVTILTEFSEDDIKRYVSQRDKLWGKNQDPENQAFIKMMERYFQDVLNSSMTLQNESDLLTLSPHQKIQLSRILAGLSPQDPDSVALVKALLYGDGEMGRRLSFFTKRLDPEFSKYPPRTEKPPILDTHKGQELKTKVEEALKDPATRLTVTQSEEDWVRSLLPKPGEARSLHGSDRRRTKTEEDAILLFREIEEIRRKREALEEHTGILDKRLQLRIEGFERDFDEQAEKEARGGLTPQQAAGLKGRWIQREAALASVAEEQKEISEAYAEVDELLTGEEERLAEIKSLQRKRLYELGGSGAALDAIEYLIEEASRQKMLPRVGSRPGTSAGFGPAEAVVKTWFEKEKAKANDPAAFDRLLSQELERRKKQQAEEATHIKKLADLGVRRVGEEGRHFDFSQANFKDPKELYRALDNLDPTLRKDFDAWVRGTYLYSGAPEVGLVALNEHMAVQGNKSGKDLKIVPVTKELREELQRDVDELRQIMIDQPHLIKKATSFLSTAAAAFSRWDADFVRAWTGLDTSHWEPSAMGKLVGAQRDSTGHLTIAARRQVDRNNARIPILIESIRRKGNLEASYPSHLKAGESYKVSANGLAKYFQDKRGEYAIYEADHLKVLDADMKSLEDTMRFTRDTAAITAGTLGAGLIANLTLRGLAGLQAIHRISQLRGVARLAPYARATGAFLHPTKQAAALGNAAYRGYALAGTTATLGGGYHYLTADETQMAKAIEAYQAAAAKGEAPPKIHAKLDLNNDGVPDGMQGHDVSFLDSLQNFNQYNRSAQNLTLFLYGQGQLMGGVTRFISNPLVAQMGANVTMSAGQGFAQRAYYKATGRPELAPKLADIGWSVANNLVWASPVDDAAILFLSRFKGFNQLSLGTQRQVAQLLGVGTNMGWSAGIGGAQEVLSKEGFVGASGQEAKGFWDAAAMSVVESLIADSYAGFKSAQSSHAMGLASSARRDPDQGLRHLDEISRTSTTPLSRDLVRTLPSHTFPGRYREAGAPLSPRHEELIRAQAELYAKENALDPNELRDRMRQAKRSESLQHIIWKMIQEKRDRATNANTP